MTEGQWAAVLFSPVSLIFGVCFIVFRRHISNAARDVRRQQGQPVTENTQSPFLVAGAGVFFACVGIVLPIAAFSGLFHTV